MFRRIAARAALRQQRRTRDPRTVQRAAALLRHGSRRIGRDTIHAAQADALRRLVRYLAEHSPFYQRKFELEGIQADEIDSLDALPGLPTTSSDELKQWERFRCVGENEIGAVFASAGTTGKPKRIDYSFQDVEVIANAGAVGLRLYHPGPLRVAMAMPMRHGLWVGWRQAMQQIERAGGLAMPVGAEDPAETLGWVRWLEPNVISSSPSYMMKMTEEARRAGDRLRLEKILLGAEPLRPEQQKHLADYWQAEVFNVYGTTEVGVGLGASLPNRSPLCFNELHLLVEIVDPETGEPADEGELLFTTLTRRAMPLLRYRVGDRATWVEVDSDLPFRYLEVLGRSDELMVVAGSNVSARVLADLVQERAGEPRKVAVELDRADEQDRLVMKVSGSLDEQKLREQIMEKYPRLQTHEENDEAAVQIQTEAELDDQLKALAVHDRRQP